MDARTEVLAGLVERDRKFADSPLEQAGFEPLVPGEMGGSFETALIDFRPSPPRGSGDNLVKGTGRRYGRGGEEMATSSLRLIDGVPRCPSRTT